MLVGEPQTPSDEKPSHSRDRARQHRTEAGQILHRASSQKDNNKKVHPQSVEIEIPLNFFQDICISQECL